MDLHVPAHSSRVRESLRVGVAIASVVFATLLGPVVTTAGATSSPTKTALIYGPSVINGTSSMEAQDLVAQGYAVTIASSTQWASMSTSEFAAYNLLVVGDPRCNDVFYNSPLTSSATTWVPAVSGNVILIGTDPAFHGQFLAAPRTAMYNMLAYAGSKANATNLYLDLSCSDAFAQPVLNVLSSGFSVQNYGTNTVDVTSAGAQQLSLTTSDLANWNSSMHVEFTQWPANYTPLAVAQSPDCSPAVTTPGGVSGCPYILSRGVVGAPTALAATRSGSTMTVTWNAGASTGPYLCTLLLGFGSPTNFTVRTSSTSCTFYGLSPLSAYGVKVSGSAGGGMAATTWAAAGTKITCVRGRAVRHVVGFPAVCPAGFHKRR